MPKSKALLRFQKVQRGGRGEGLGEQSAQPFPGDRLVAAAPAPRGTAAFGVSFGKEQPLPGF